MFPVVMRAYERAKENVHKSQASKFVANMLKDAQHIGVDFDLYDYAMDVALEHSLSFDANADEDSLGIEAPDGSMIFAPVVTLTIFDVPNMRTDGFALFVRGSSLAHANINDDAVYCFVTNGENLKLLLGWIPGRPGFAVSGLMECGCGQDEAIQNALQFAFLFQIINQERFVKKTAAAPRQQRRSIERKLGFAVNGWHSVTWNVGSEVKAKVAETDSENARPLHFARAHWRRAQEGQPKAQRRNDAPGWWCWVKESWRGHPAFGVKLHHYTPKIGRKNPAA